MNSLISLPIDDFIQPILDTLKNEDNLVITAAPGAGKTTRLPAALLQLVEKKIIVLEPRRMAAIAAAHRIAEEQGWQVGQEVGYQVRFAHKTSLQTRLIFMTEALLARQMITDPELTDVELVILDEFHERSAQVDLALGLLRELQELGRKIKVVVMSASLDAEKISAYLNNCPIISVPGKLHDLEIRYQKGSQLLQTPPSFYDVLFQTLKEAQHNTTKDILVFLPGVGEIERAQRTLEIWAQQKRIALVPLHGSLRIEEQRQALQKSSGQRIILSTNIAESSVTLDGVNTVIDSGLAKVMRQDHRTGFSRLEMSRISLSSALQRAGRAARQFPGVCYRLWNKMDELSFSQSEVAEIQRIDLSECLLFLSAQGVRDFESFKWFEKPTPIAMQSALRFLRISGTLSEKNELTDIGKKILRFPLPVRLGKLMLVGLDLGMAELASDVTALLQERDILQREAAQSFLGDNLECDLSARLELLRQHRKIKRASTVERSAQQIAELARRMPSGPRSNLSAQSQLKTLLLIAFADRLCRRRGKSDRALMVGGRGVKLQPESLVKTSEFFVALSGVEGNTDAETAISLACGFDKDFILLNFKDQVSKNKEVSFYEDKGHFFVREYRSLFGLPLEEPSLLPASPEEVAEKLPDILLEKFDLVLKGNEKLAHWWSRLQFLDQQRPQNLEIDHLLKSALIQACLGESRMQSVIDKDLVFYFENVFPPDVVRILRQEVPGHLEVPSGSKISVTYPLDKAPFIEVRIQEIFGLMETPKVFFGQIPVTLHLLAPNFRPVQVTANLESFWKNGYPEVRKELRLRYPKHQWPENPADGRPEAKGRKQK